MLNSKLWRDAILYEADNEGVGVGAETSEGDGDDGEMTLEQMKAELERTRAALKKANDESAGRRKKLEELEAAEEARKTAELSEAQKAAARAEKAEAELKALADRHRRNAIQAAVRLEAVTLGFVDPADAAALTDLSGVTLDDDDQVIGADKAVQALAKAKPHLIKQATTTTDINARNSGRQTSLTPEQIADSKRKSGNYTPF